jgi:hypothetical protein
MMWADDDNMVGVEGVVGGGGRMEAGEGGREVGRAVSFWWEREARGRTGDTVST